MAATEISKLSVINKDTVNAAILEVSDITMTRLIITDTNTVAIYDSYGLTDGVSNYILLPEVISALGGKDVFSWSYHNGTMQSKSAVPIYTNGTLMGCAYIMEYDAEQGALIRSLQNTILVITCILEVAVILFSLIFSRTFSRRIRRIMDSFRIIREGDYSHRVKIPGKDELSVLGNEFNDLTERLQISEQVRSNFVSDASHELKTPLASIKLLTDSILQNDVDMEMTREFVADIGNEADRLNRMSQKLLSLSKIDSLYDTDYEIINIGPTIEKVLRMLSANAQKNQITTNVSLIQDSPILISEDDLYQIIFNLIENGIKYNKPGGSLAVTLDRQEDSAVLTIADTGVGIPEDAISHIFDRFYRVDKARSRKSGGSGLGLSIVNSMVARNNGKISVESQLGCGTTFTITFPVFETEEAL